ncbi:golgin subfamily A member 1 isoform X1 [Cephus cinctus]|uniref:Golgin subfamily A member 1 isoform X1 n=1 Tax=Cephus cinctus TaxID=211228 RepID=A0AAJ7RFA1_CEPCN|nr:golgin subfamily A member 1 isoform X1 [Cephus cinctus]XP_024939554.1 golgin subfamily A member 1 isoform X1 [Cephus cinctus]
MFASLKNKIREEIGSDVSTVVRNAGTIRGVNTKHLSQAGSTSSISGSQISLDGSREGSSPIPAVNLKRENSFEVRHCNDTQQSGKDIRKFEIQEDECHKSIQKKEFKPSKKIDENLIVNVKENDNERTRSRDKERLEDERKNIEGGRNEKIKKSEEDQRTNVLDKEKAWKKTRETNKDKTKLEEERQKADSAKQTLEFALRSAEEYKRKLYTYQEETELLEGFQTQEMAKIKHLLLAKEQEAQEKTQQLKAASTEIENLKAEVSRLRRYEDELNNVQDEMEILRHSTQRERAQLSSQLAQTEEEVRHLKDKLFVLEQRLALQSNDQVTVDERIAELMRERTLLERKLEETHFHLSDIKTSWSGKISSLETQVGRLSRQAGEEGLERRRVEQEKEVLAARIKQLEAEIEVNNVVMATKDAKLLRMAEDIDEMATELKELRSNVDFEVEEFKQQIESSSREIKQLRTELEETSAKLTSATSEVAHLRLSFEGEKSNNSSLHLEVARLRENLESERTATATLRVCLEKERNEKDGALLRNAQVSQDIEMAKHESRRQEVENVELQNRLEVLEGTLRSKGKEVDDLSRALEESRKRMDELEEAERSRERVEGNEKMLKNSLTDMEEQLIEKTKTIKVLQQRLSDMKKTLQRELRVPSSSLDSDAEPSAAILSPSSSKTVTAKQSNSREDDVNFKYLKHVLIKFLTSREYEALHLTRAVATLLHFSPEEERLLQETLEWKMSWFGTRPNLGIGQTAKAIPPS